MKMENPDQNNRCAVADIARRKAITAAEDAGRPIPGEAELAKIELEALRKVFFGFDYRTDARGNPIEQGIGAWPEKVTNNHMQGILKYEGRAAYDAAVKKLWRDSPKRAQAIGLPQPTRAGAGA
jgi:hypothetical protein